MIISPKKAYDKKYITKLIDPEKQVGSDGIDLTLFAIAKVDTTDTAVLTEEKQFNKHRNREGLGFDVVDGKKFYTLTQGVYDITFNEGCSLPKGISGQIILRSSLVRNGCIGVAGWYDQGFNTSNMGFFLHVPAGGKLRLEQDVRIAQIVLHVSKGHKLYDGQYNHQSGTNWLTSWLRRE